MEFNRIIKLLRKERGITQSRCRIFWVSRRCCPTTEKASASADSVVRVADYYNVSCDYLLGRSAERNGMMLSAEDLPNPEKMKDNVYHGSVLPTMNKKLISTVQRCSTPKYFASATAASKINGNVPGNVWILQNV